MGLSHDILNDPVAELSMRQVIPVTGETPVRQAVAQMQRERLGCVVVVDADNRPIGKFTERLLIKLLTQTPAALDGPVKEQMASAWAWVETTDPIAKVIQYMDRDKLRFVIVIDEHGHPIGLTGQKGVLKYIADHFPRQVMVQQPDPKLHMDQREGA